MFNILDSEGRTCADTAKSPETAKSPIDVVCCCILLRDEIHISLVISRTTALIALVFDINYARLVARAVGDGVEDLLPDTLLLLRTNLIALEHGTHDTARILDKHGT